MAQDDIYQSTQNLLRTVVILTQGLGPLPASAYLSIKLTYYDEVTPADYEPTGYCATELIAPRLPSGVQSLNSGKVATAHHSIRLKVLAVPRDIVGDKETSTVVSDDYLCSQSQANPSSQLGSQSTFNQDTMPAPGSQESEAELTEKSEQCVKEDMEAESASLLDPYLTVLCSCGNANPDPLMLVCYFCSRSQHAACYRILDKTKVPVTHCCVPCSQVGEGRVCTDPKLVKMSSKADVSGTCMYRRVLAVLNVTGQVSLSTVAETFGISEELAEKVINKLEKENVVTQCAENQFEVNKLILQRVALPKYLGIKLDVASIVKQAGEMSIGNVDREVPGTGGDGRVEDKRKRGAGERESGRIKRIKGSVTNSKILM